MGSNLLILLHVLAFTSVAISSSLDESRCSNFQYEYRVLERIIFLENKNAELEKKHEELVGTLKGQKREIEHIKQQTAAHIIYLNNTKEELLSEIGDAVQGTHKSNDSKVAFTARLSKGYNLNRGQTIKFDNILTNTGGGYSASTGLFTAPESGTYLFSITITVRNGWANIYLMKDTKELGTIYPYDWEGSHHNRGSESVTVAVDLVQGNTVYVKYVSGASRWTYSIYHNNYCTFTGIMLL